MAVTITKRRTNVNGAFREVYLNLNVGVNGDTYDTKLKAIIMADSNNPGAITSITFGQTNGILTFNTTGAVNNAYVRALGW